MVPNEREWLSILMKNNVIGGIIACLGKQEDGYMHKDNFNQ